MRIAHSIIIIAMLSLVVSGCVASGGGSGNLVGSGPINLSKNVKSNLYWYQNELGFPMYFAVSIDGKHEGHGYCNSGFSCGVYSDPGHAINNCEAKSKGVPCKIYAEGKNIVWKTDAPKKP